jgi:branched-chain amino acid transport system permease protein
MACLANLGNDYIKLMSLPQKFTQLGLCMPLILGLSIILVLPFIVDISWIFLVTELAILILYAMAYNLTFGVAGMLSFGHGGLFGAGAYVLAIATIKADIPFPYALLAAPVLTALITFVIGWFCIRLTGIYFAILTLAFGQLIWATIWKMRTITGGDDGLVGLQAPSVIASATHQYFFILAIVMLALLLMKRIVDSPFGFTLKTIRENQTRAQSIGINIRRFMLLAFTISGFFTGLAGALFAILIRGAFADFATVSKAFEPIFAGVLGGMHVFWGPAFGAGILLALDKFVGSYTEYWPLVAGGILMLLVLFLPEGIIGRLQLIRNRRAQNVKH